jgi:hypothetical protein
MAKGVDMKMKMNLSHADVYNSHGDSFNCEIFAWTDENGIESKQLSRFSNWKDFNYVIKEEPHDEGAVISFTVENKKRIHRRLKLFFLLDWRNAGEERLSFVSPDDHLVYHHSSTKVSMIDYQVSSGMIRRSLYPLTDKGIFHWKETLKTGSLLYQPLLKGPALTVVSFDLLFRPLQKVQGDIVEIEADSKEDMKNFHKHFKNRLAFHLKK